MSREDIESLEKFLHRLNARSILTNDEKAAVLRLPTRRVNVKAKRDFIGLHEEVTSSCLIVSGLVGRFEQETDGTRQVVAFHVPGDMADLHSAVRPIGTGGLTAICDSTILKVLHTDIFDLCALTCSPEFMPLVS